MVSIDGLQTSALGLNKLNWPLGVSRLRPSVPLRSNLGTPNLELLLRSPFGTRRKTVRGLRLGSAQSQ